MTTVHLIRHAEHGLLGRTLTGRMPGVGLNDAGRAQAVCLARLRVDTVVSSPQQRAQETAAAFGLPVQVDPAWDELDFGAWSGREFSQLEADPAWHHWNIARSVAPTPGGETMLEVQARAVAGLMALRAYEDVAVVSHLDVLRAVLAHVLGMPLDHLFRMELAPASRSIVELSDGGLQVTGLNLTPAC